MDGWMDSWTEGIMKLITAWSEHKEEWWTGGVENIFLLRGISS
jgi:hypothetical protein